MFRLLFWGLAQKLDMELATLLTVNLVLSSIILLSFALVLGLIVIIVRKKSQSLLNQAQVSIESQSAKPALQVNTAAASFTSSAQSSNSFVPIDLNNSSSKSGYFSRSFTSKAALDKKILPRGLADIC